MATEAGGTRPTGMQSCLEYILCQFLCPECNWKQNIILSVFQPLVSHCSLRPEVSLLHIMISKC